MVRRVLVTGWPSFLHGEATAGDVLAMEAVADGLRLREMAVDPAWSPRFRPGAGPRSLPLIRSSPGSPPPWTEP